MSFGLPGIDVREDGERLLHLLQRGQPLRPPFAHLPTVQLDRAFNEKPGQGQDAVLDPQPCVGPSVYAQPEAELRAAAEEERRFAAVFVNVKSGAPTRSERLVFVSVQCVLREVLASRTTRASARPHYGRDGDDAPAFPLAQVGGV